MSMREVDDGSQPIVLPIVEHDDDRQRVFAQNRCSSEVLLCVDMETGLLERAR